MPLSVAGAFHTHLMKPADDRLAEAVAKATISRPRIPVLSNVDGKSHEDPDEIRAKSRPASRQPGAVGRFRLRRCSDRRSTSSTRSVPGRVLRGMLKRIDRKADCHTVNDSPPDGTGPLVRFQVFAAQGTRHLYEPPGDPRAVQGTGAH